MEQKSLFDDASEINPKAYIIPGPQKNLPKKKTMPEIIPDNVPNQAIPKIKKTSTKKTHVKKPDHTKSKKEKRKRTPRPYPAVSFREGGTIAEAIFKHASGDKVRRLTLLEKMDRNPTSSSTNMLITNSGKYGITIGGYSADFLELTESGRIACDPDTAKGTRLEYQFKLAIQGIEPFRLLYEAYVGKKLPAHEMMKDRLLDGGIDAENFKECIDLFVVNVKYLGLLRTIASAETLISIEQALEDIAGVKNSLPANTAGKPASANQHNKQQSSTKWQTICFYISPIGDDGSASRKHSDLYLSTLIEPALKELNLEVVRADKIAEPGMITTHILEHIKLSKLVIADLSLLNPNVFYEMALRHSLKLPIIQIIRKSDRLPFDVNQVNSIIIDDTDIYTFTPKLETYRSEITTLTRHALEDPEHVGNPISVFYPDFWK